MKTFTFWGNSKKYVITIFGFRKNQMKIKSIKEHDRMLEICIFGLILLNQGYLVRLLGCCWNGEGSGVI